MSSSKKFSPINNINELNKFLNTSNESSSVTDSSSKKFSVVQLNNNKINNLKNLLDSTEENIFIGGSINSSVTSSDMPTMNTVSATSSAMPAMNTVSATSSAMPAMNTVSATSSEVSDDKSLEILPKVVNFSETETELNQDTEKLLDLLKNQLE